MGENVITMLATGNSAISRRCTVRTSLLLEIVFAVSALCRRLISQPIDIESTGCMFKQTTTHRLVPVIQDNELLIGLPCMVTWTSEAGAVTSSDVSWLRRFRQA